MEAIRFEKRNPILQASKIAHFAFFFLGRYAGRCIEDAVDDGCEIMEAATLCIVFAEEKQAARF